MKLTNNISYDPSVVLPVDVLEQKQCFGLFQPVFDGFRYLNFVGFRTQLRKLFEGSCPEVKNCSQDVEGAIHPVPCVADGREVAKGCTV